MRVCASSRMAGRGFTLVELMVVVVLLSVMTALIIPEMRGTFEDAVLRGTARQLTSRIRLASSQAVLSGRTYRVRIDRPAELCVIEAAQAGSAAFKPVEGLPGGQEKLDSRIEVEVRTVPAAIEGDADEAAEEEEEEVPATVIEPGGEPDSIRLYSDGTADSAEVLLRDREGFELLLRVNATTARVQIERPERRKVP